MGEYKKITKKILTENKKVVLENMLKSLYDNNIKERMHPKLEEDLIYGNHSLAECGIFPDTIEVPFEIRLMNERFKNVVNNCREAFDVDMVDNMKIVSEMMGLVFNSQKMEKPIRKKLEELAVSMVMEEFDIPEGKIIFEAKLKDTIVAKKTTKKSSKDNASEIFESHDEIVLVNDEIKKRRTINSLIQGAAKNVNHMFHIKRDELNELNPRLVNGYKKMMSAADYMFYLIPDIQEATTGGQVVCEFKKDKKDNITPVVKAEAMVFPVLVHELYKGVMEILSTHGIPNKKNIAEYVMSNSDYLDAEPWDMRLGPQIWSKFCATIPYNDFGLKHQVYAELISLPANEFRGMMKEILAGTKKGNNFINEKLDKIKKEIQDDEFNNSMGDMHFGMDELF